MGVIGLLRSSSRKPDVSRRPDRVRARRRSPASSIYDMRHLLLYLVLLPCCGAVVASDTVHRWTDERGIVNYGDAPPKGARATAVPINDPLTVSGSPAGPRPAAPADARPASALDRDAVREEIDAALRREQSARIADAERRQEAVRLEARRRCEAQRRVDCDDVLPADEYLHFAPPRIIRHPNVWQPVKPVTTPPNRPVEPPALMKGAADSRGFR